MLVQEYMISLKFNLYSRIYKFPGQGDVMVSIKWQAINWNSVDQFAETICNREPQ